MNRCLSGTWNLRSQGSDYLPGLERFDAMPFPALLTPEVDSWLQIYQKQSFGDVEEIVFAYRAGRTESRTFQIGKLNYERVSSSGVVLASVRNTDAEFRECTIYRYGPACGQTSEEVYSLDENGEEVRVAIDMNMPDGTNVKLVRYLERCTDAGGSMFSSGEIPPLRFIAWDRSFGWEKLREIRNGTFALLADLSIKLCEPIDIVTPNDGVPPPLPPAGSGGANGGTAQIYHKYTITKRYADHVSNGENVTIYEILVQLKGTNSSVWIVPHRYKEFHALKLFVDQEDRATRNATGSRSITSRLPSFPGKILMQLTGLQRTSRAEGLDNYLSALISAVVDGHGNEAIAGALCAFLEIPENLVGPLQHEKRTMSEVTGTKGAPSAAAKAAAAASASASASASAGGKKVPVTIIPAKPPAGKNAPVAQLSLSAANLAAVSKQAAAPAPATTDNIANRANAVTPAKPQRRSSTGTTAMPAVSPTVSSWMNRESTMANNAASAAHRAAQEALRALLLDGMLIIKHGRTGKPKKRLLLCNNAVSRIYWSDEIDHHSAPHAPGKDGDKLHDIAKSVDLYEVTDLRKGTDEDIHKPNKKGTSVLRRTASEDVLPICCSLITKQRSLDLQFLSQADFDRVFPLLVVHIKNIIDAKAAAESSPPTSSAPNASSNGDDFQRII